MIVVAKILVVASLLNICQGQVLNCEAVTTGLAPALEPCSNSVTDCVNSPDFDLPVVGSLLCNPIQEGQFNNFLTCTNRSFTDEIYATICGGVGCSSDVVSSYSQCNFTEAERCYSVPTLNDGEAAFDACDCLEEGQTFSTCSSECREQLSQLIDDVGCCAHAAIYTFFFSSCGDANISPPLQTIDVLFESCDVTLPPTCFHPFSPEEEGSTNSAILITSSSLILLSFVLVAASLS